MNAAAAAAVVALCVQDRVPLRSAPRESAPRQAELWQGDSLEVRGRDRDYLQVYDHRRERAGYVKASQVREYVVDPAAAPELRAVVRFLRDTPGAEALGIGYVALYLKAVDAPAMGTEALDALGTMAERLGRRASVRRASPADEAAFAGHLEVAASYGVALGAIGPELRLCYDGDAFRRVLGLGGSAEERARAALGLTRPECVDPDQGPAGRRQTLAEQAEVLDAVALADLPPHLAHRVRLRRATVWAGLAFAAAVHGEPSAAAGERALAELATVAPAELAEDDRRAYAEAAVRVGASRFAAAVPASPGPTPLAVALTPGERGQTCVRLTGPDGAAGAERCTFGVVWAASARARSDGGALALAVQPLEGWRELWLFQRAPGGWRCDVVPPSGDGPDLGYVDFAGWVPGGTRLLLAREARIEGRIQRSFEVMALASLEVERRADRPEALTAFYRHQDPAWKRLTVALRLP